MKKRLPIVLLLVVAVAAITFWLRSNRTAEEGFPRLHGNVDIREVNLGFRVPGRIATVLRDEGDAVAEGEILAKLDAVPYERELSQARAQVEALRARVQLLENGPRPQELAQARAVVREREATLTNAERVFKRQDDLLASKAVAVQDRDDAEARFREAEARLNSAREQLGLLEAGYRVEEIAQAKAELARAEAALANAQLRLDDTILKSPSPGVVLTRAEEPGAIVQAGETILTVSLSNPVWVRAYVAEPDLGKVRPGMKAEIRTDSHPDKPYLGQVGYISPRAEFTPKHVETAHLRTSLVYRLRIVVENADAGLRQGMPVAVLLKTDE